MKREQVVVGQARSRTVPFVLAVLVHVLLAGFLFFSLDWSPKTVSKPVDVDLVQATIIDQTQVVAEQRKEAERHKREADAKRKKEEERTAAEQQKQEQAQRDKERQLKEVEQQKQAQEKQQQQEEQQRAAAAAEKQKKSVENAKKVKAEKELKERQQEKQQQEKLAQQQKLQAEAERKKSEEALANKKKEAAELNERKKRAEAERKRRQTEDEELMRKQMEAEQQSLDAASAQRNERLTVAYSDAIKLSVQRAWRKPAGATPAMKCTVHVTQLPSGEVLDAKIASCTTSDEDFRSSVVNAIFKASPLPKPADMAVFQREIEFTFEPLQ